MLEPLKHIVNQEEADYYECRRCGTSLDRPKSACQHCGSREIAYYDL